MKRILIQRPEPLLLAIPLLLFLLDKVFFDNAIKGIQQLDTRLLFWIGFIFIIVPFQLHFLLRAARKWDPVFCRPHVYLTTGLLLLMFVTFYSSTQPLPEAAYDVPPSGNIADQFSYSNKSFAYLLLIEFILQFLFVIYFLIRLFQKK